MKTSFNAVIVLALGLASFATRTHADDASKKPSRRPAVSYFVQPKCNDMAALVKATSDAAPKSMKIVGGAEEKPSFITWRVSEGPYDQWTVYLSSNDCTYAFAVFTDTGACTVKSVPFELNRDCR